MTAFAAERLYDLAASGCVQTISLQRSSVRPRLQSDRSPIGHYANLAATSSQTVPPLRKGMSCCLGKA